MRRAFIDLFGIDLPNSQSDGGLMDCLLCQSSQTAAFQVTKKPERSYFHCGQCDLIFMDPHQRPSAQEEKARYDFHQNDGSSGHQAFLSPLVEDILTYISEQKTDIHSLKALDFGCGPHPFLSLLLGHKGLQVTNYDLFYFPDQDHLRRNYHVITSTEVWEHFAHPRAEIARLVRILKEGGLLAVMTSAHKGEGAFHDWYYRRDETHVTFFSEKSMQWIAQEFHLKLVKAKSPYWLFVKLAKK